ncbi:hypothetical protein AZE42_08848 [Rhizopogon vesiculosus]|uniref:Uncharacterized protein n=1 Tax=Rhizopogon vesiculosus TaxID=180088 RepID=A0A1J8Q3R5_9AGAM|nr:hypothetical protein AZE42_08848 [Rhizopogon vesiculosus]
MVTLETADPSSAPSSPIENSVKCFLGEPSYQTSGELCLHLM